MRTELQSGCFLRAVCLLLVTFDPGAAKRCPTCDPGYFVIKNCSGNEGIQCSRCTDCSASHKETLVNCSTFADSLCGNKTPPTTAQPAVAGPAPGCINHIDGCVLQGLPRVKTNSAVRVKNVGETHKTNIRASKSFPRAEIIRQFLRTSQPTPAPWKLPLIVESAAEVWIPITVAVSSLLLVLLAVSLAMLSRWKHQPKKPDGPDQRISLENVGTKILVAAVAVVLLHSLLSSAVPCNVILRPAEPCSFLLNPAASCYVHPCSAGPRYIL